MRQTPERIWLREDSEDPDYILWGNDQPADDEDGVEYIRADLVQFIWIIVNHAKRLENALPDLAATDFGTLS